jgi:hypothetical protein
MKLFFGLFFILLLLNPKLYAEDWSWWNTKHNWDEITPWENYMRLSSKYMGPNALPVPEITNGSIPKSSFVETGIAGHLSRGDKAANAVLNAIVKAGNRAAIGIYFVPYETYNMDTNTSRNIRGTRDYDGKGHAVGDVYISGYFQILKSKPKGLDLMLTFGVKTASGNNLEAGRYTDAPGYFFHLSAGRTIPFPGAFFKSIRHYIMTGGNFWQTYRHDYKQDDSFLYGGGITLENKNFTIDEQIGGYFGYINDGDRPLVNRLSIKTNRERLVNYKLLFQYGFADAPYKSLIISSLFNIEKLHKKAQNTVKGEVK